MSAATAVFARQGVDATRINEITDEADLGFGSFYNYFESKDAIVDAVLERAAAQAGAAIDAASADIEDPAEVVAVGHRALVELAAADPEWAWLLVRLDVSHDIALNALAQYALRDIERGIEAGRFVVEDKQVALHASAGALLRVVRGVIEGRLTREAASPHAAGILRMLGVPAKQAARIATKPLPELAELARRLDAV